MDDIVATLRSMRLCPTICTAAAEEIERLRAALAPFAKMSSAMYVSGHCGGASPEDWPAKWSVHVQGFDGDHFHSPQQFGGLLKVADFRAATAALSSR